MHRFRDSSRRSAAGSYDPFLAIVRDPRAHGSAWLERIPDKDEVPGSNPGGPTVREPLHSKGSRSFGGKYGDPQNPPAAHRVHIRSRVGRLEAVGGSLIQTLEQVPIDIQSGLDRRVTEPFLDDFGVFPLGDQERSM